jgi:tetratricopeptide (TPR) repeat protein
MSQRIMALWDNREANMLEQLGRREEALLVWRANAESQPWDVYAQQNYAQRLEIGGEFDAAHAWLRQELARPERSPYDDEILRSAVAELYRKQGKWNELQSWTTDWISRNPETTSYHSPYGQHISAMIFNDQLEAAYALAHTMADRRSC